MESVIRQKMGHFKRMKKKRTFLSAARVG